LNTTIDQIIYHTQDPCH